MNGNNHFKPSILLSEIFGLSKRKPGFIVGKVEAVARDGYFRAIETGCFYPQEDRRRIAAITRDHDIEVVQWLTEVIDEDKLDLCALDETLRHRSVERLKAELPGAAECGATTVSIVTGVDPGRALREKGYESLYRSLDALCAAAADLGMSVMAEPLDRFAHKKRLLGPADEAVALLRDLRQKWPTVGYAFDTAHTELNEEDMLATLALARDEIDQIHLSNAVLRKDDPLYGDHHMLPGTPGFLTVEAAAGILREAHRLGIRQDQGLRVAVEARPATPEEEVLTERLASTFLQDVVARSEETV